MNQPDRILPNSSAAGLDHREEANSQRGARLRGTLGTLKFELATLLLILLSILAVRYQDVILRKTYVLTPTTTASVHPGVYDDRVAGGHSEATPDPVNPTGFSCVLRPGYGNPFCGMELVLADPSGRHGVDLTGYDSLKIRLRYHGAAHSFRLFLKNHDPRYSIPNQRQTAKFHQIEIFTNGGEIEKDIPLKDFTVADWWVMREQRSLEMTRPQLDNVVSIDFSTATQSAPGPYEFQIESVTLNGTIITPAQWYLIIMGVWVLLIAAFITLRIVHFRRRAERERARERLKSEKLQRAKAAAEQASTAKSAFLSNMSHELRTPLNAILGYAQLLERVQTSDQHRAAARTIRSSGIHLLTLITDILDLSKIEAGKLELCPTPFDLQSCLTGIEDMIRIRADEKGLRFGCTIDPDVPQHVVGDEKRLRQVLINLLGNAVKFTQHGQVAMRVSLLDNRRGRASLRFEVRDTGPGLDAAERARIFRPFEQAGDAERRADGTGLGLSISRQLVDLMEGRIDVESIKCEGSRFWFDIAMDVADASFLAAPAPAAGDDVPAPAAAAGDPALLFPPEEEMAILLELAKAGNMRGIIRQAEKLLALGEDYRPFAERLQKLARGYQSPALLHLIESDGQPRKAA
jgi:signal transduction histidine kinase